MSGKMYNKPLRLFSQTKEIKDDRDEAFPNFMASTHFLASCLQLAVSCLLLPPAASVSFFFFLSRTSELFSPFLVTGSSSLRATAAITHLLLPFSPHFHFTLLRLLASPSLTSAAVKLTLFCAVEQKKSVA